MKRTKTRWWLATLLVGTLFGAATFGAVHDAPSDALPTVRVDAPEAVRGVAAFLGEDFGGLSLSALQSHAVPWKLTFAALAMRERGQTPEAPVSKDVLERALARYGFLSGVTPVNLPAGLTVSETGLPLGMTHGTITPVAGLPIAVANLGCASCHAGVTYGADGRPDPASAWLGAPNTSLDLEAYVADLSTATAEAARDPGAWMVAVAALYPETGWRERQVLRWLVIPLIKARLAALDGASPLPFPNGHPGTTNGVAALKHAFALPLHGGGPGDNGIVSIPDLGHRDWRSSLLADGSYAPPGGPRQVETASLEDARARRGALAAITTFFTVPSMGVAPENALSALPSAEEIFAFLGERYRPPPYPGALNADLARRGAAVYARDCAACHGDYRISDDGPQLRRFPNWLGDVGTDPLRADMFTQALAEAVNASAYGDRIAARATGVYAAPPLSGLWASAPYLHNGSVPSVRALLTPGERPERFDVGGHALDFDSLGIAYPSGHTPFAGRKTVDTRRPGLGNRGHRFGESLSRDEKNALLEFLKQL